MIIFRKFKKEYRLVKKEILGQVIYNNIIKIKQAFLESKYLKISIKYCQFTLKEIIYIYIRLEEVQL
jgi:hypothetical protein